MIDYAIQKANDLTYEQGKRRVYAVVTDDRDRILAEGHNSYTKTHPVQAKYAEQVDLPDKVFLHAEIMALVRIRHGEPHKIYVARVDSEGNPCYACPCAICNRAIKEAGIKTVEYTA